VLRHNTNLRGVKKMNINENFEVKVSESGRGTHLKGIRINEGGGSVVVARLVDNAGYYGELKMYKVYSSKINTKQDYIRFEGRRIHVG
jgi:hypothetical protein